MEPLGGVRVGVDAGVVGGELLHFVEAMIGRISHRLVAHVPLAREVCRVAVLLKELSNGWGLGTKIILVSRGHHDRQCRPNRDPPGHKRRASGRAACLSVPTREDGSLFGHLVDVGCRVPKGCASTRIRTEVVPSSVVGHKHDDVGFVRFGLPLGFRQPASMKLEMASAPSAAFRTFAPKSIKTSYRYIRFTSASRRRRSVVINSSEVGAVNAGEKLRKSYPTLRGVEKDFRPIAATKSRVGMKRNCVSTTRHRIFGLTFPTRKSVSSRSSC